MGLSFISICSNRRLERWGEGEREGVRGGGRGREKEREKREGEKRGRKERDLARYIG